MGHMAVEDVMKGGSDSKSSIVKSLSKYLPHLI